MVRRLCLVLFALALALVSSRVCASQLALEALLRQEEGLLQGLRSLAETVVTTAAEIEETRHELGQLNYQLIETERRIAALERRSAQRIGHLRLGARRLYKLSRGGLARLVFDDSHGGDLASRLSTAQQIIRRDAKELALYRAELERLGQHKRKLEARRGRAQRAEQRLLRQHETLQSGRRAMLVARRQLQRSRRAQQGGQPVDGQTRLLAARIAELSVSLGRAEGFASKRGRLPRPVSGSVEDSFGRAVERGGRKIEVMRNGLTFRATRRAQVRAVADGKVLMAGPLPRYGTVVLLEHGGGFHTLYGFLSQGAVRVGQSVSQRAVLGRVGVDPLSDRPALYFELRQGGRSLDPTAWLQR
jgi:septal ring factor EnvC (AmiA/AmiB activator)